MVKFDSEACGSCTTDIDPSTVGVLFLPLIGEAATAGGNIEGYTTSGGSVLVGYGLVGNLRA